jgi:hypothetical protein
MEKTISFLILIGIGVLFKNKIQNKEQVDTIKTLILTVALPAVIFSALLKIDLTFSSIYPPLLVLGFNFLIFLSVRHLLPIFTGKNTPQSDLRTLTLMLPSLAPYLSCFPFISEFSDESSLGLAAIADTGNKIFILIFLYFLAMYWTCGKKIFSNKEKSSKRLVEILLQPINLTIIIALTASLFGIKLETIPVYLQDSLAQLRNLLTPTILIFIGLAVKVKGKDLKLILGLLLWRSAITFMLSAILISLLHFDVSTTLLVVAFPQSSCSFIPYAQMTIFTDLQDKSKKVFNPSLALSLLAISLPFSSFIIISIYSSGDIFTSPVNLLRISAIALVLSGILLRKKVRSTRNVSVLAR